MNFREESLTAEACLTDVKLWVGNPEHTAEDIAVLIDEIRVRTKSDIELISSAVGMIMNDKNEVLLLKRTAKDRSYPDIYSFAGGQKDPEDADLGVTALREAEEETGQK